MAWRLPPDQSAMGGVFGTQEPPQFMLSGMVPAPPAASFPEQKRGLLDTIARALSGESPWEGTAYRLGRNTVEHLKEKPPFDWGAFRGPSGERDDPMRARQAEATVPLALGAAIGATPFAPRGSLGIFGGRLAQTADHAMLTKAEELAAKGAPREQIWNETGWFKGADDKWRFEIPDNKAQLNPNLYADKLPKASSAQRSPAAGEMWHPDLYEAYPDARNIGMKVQSGNGGVYYPWGGEKGAPRIDVRARNPTEGTSIGVHEMQHHAQQREGFAKGGDPSYLNNKIPNPDVAVYENALNSHPVLKQFNDLENSAAYRAELAASNARYVETYQPRLQAYQGNNSKTAQRKVQELFEEMNKDRAGKYPLLDQRSGLIDQLHAAGIPVYRPGEFLPGHSAYRQLAGEVEARNAQTRIPMTPEQRKAAPPWTTEDVPAGKQIVRYD